jgi:hypothetical protein
VTAKALYQGDHWLQTVEVVNAAQKQGYDAELWVLSTGYGLIPADQPVLKPYNATFVGVMGSQSIKDIASVEADSDAITPRHWDADKRRDYSHAWWSAIAAWQPENSAFPRTLTQLARGLPLQSRVLIIASEPYLEVILGELPAVAEALGDNDRLLVVSAGASPRLKRDLGHHQLPVDGRFTQVVGGAKTSLNARAARWLVQTVVPAEFGVKAAQAALTQASASLEKLTASVRSKMTDEEVSRFIEESAPTGPLPSAGRMLTRLRASGRACEAKRFGTLWRQVSEKRQALHK